MNSFMNSRIALSAAVVGLVGAAGLYIYEQIKSANRRAHVEMAALRGQVNTLQSDLESLKRLQTQIQSQEEARSKKFKKVPNRKRPTVTPSNAGDTSIADISYTSDSDFHTVIDTDTENEDNFFDINSDDESSHDSDKTMVPSDTNSTRSENTFVTPAYFKLWLGKFGLKWKPKVSHINEYICDTLPFCTKRLQNFHTWLNICCVSLKYYTKCIKPFV